MYSISCFPLSDLFRLHYCSFRFCSYVLIDLVLLVPLNFILSFVWRDLAECFLCILCRLVWRDLTLPYPFPTSFFVTYVVVIYIMVGFSFSFGLYVISSSSLCPGCVVILLTGTLSIGSIELPVDDGIIALITSSKCFLVMLEISFLVLISCLLLG